jgi:hypothetical protein
MFCPECGIEDQSRNPFCRGCGTSLNPVRASLERSDEITTSAVTAREEIGRAIAVKIAEIETAGGLREAVYEILPVVESFLESPEERSLNQYQRGKRLNQMHEGVLTAVVGLGIILCSLLISWVTGQEKILVVSALGLLVLIIGGGIIVTALWFTVLPKKKLPSSDRLPTGGTPGEKPDSIIETEAGPVARYRFPSVTEGTTREL